MRRCLAVRRDVRTSRPSAAGDLLRPAGACFLALAAALATVVHGASPPMTLRFGAEDYHHRWSKDDQSEFTPANDADLAR